MLLVSVSCVMVDSYQQRHHFLLVVNAPVAKSADAPNSKLGSLCGMWVRVPPGVPQPPCFGSIKSKAMVVLLYLVHTNAVGVDASIFFLWSGLLRL